MRLNSRAKQLTELLFSSSGVFIPSRPKLLLIFTDRRDIYRLIRSGTLECRSICDRLTYHCSYFPPSMTDECFENNDVMIKRLTGKWDVWRNENKDDSWPTDRWVQGLNKKKQQKKKRKERKTQQSTFFDIDLFYFPLVDVITGSLH